LSPPLVPTAGYACAKATRRRRGEDGISFEHRGPCRDPERHRHRHCPGLWRGEFRYADDGRRERRKVSGRTKAAVVDKLRELRSELDHGIIPETGYTSYTVLGITYSAGPASSWERGRELPVVSYRAAG